MGSSSIPAVVLWLRQVSDVYLRRAESPEPVDADSFGPKVEPRWLQWEDGLRLSLAFANARYLKSIRQRRMFRDGLHELPSEVVLYWFTLCFYGYRQPAGKAAFRTLLTYGDAADKPDTPQKEAAQKTPQKPPKPQLGLFVEKTA